VLCFDEFFGVSQIYLDGLFVSALISMKGEREDA
jgi:hypothetical protein